LRSLSSALARAKRVLWRLRHTVVLPGRVTLLASRQTASAPFAVPGWAERHVENVSYFVAEGVAKGTASVRRRSYSALAQLAA